MVARANFTVKPATFQWRTVTERKNVHGVRFCVTSTAPKFARVLLNAVSSWHIACPSGSGFEINLWRKISEIQDFDGDMFAGAGGVRAGMRYN